MARALITGAHGFIGRYLARTLHSEGHVVAGLGHGAWSALEAAGAGLSFWINGEISPSNLGQISVAMDLPDVVFHLAGGSSVGAAVANPNEDFHRTVASTAALLEWLRQHSPATRLVAVSSAAVYGASHRGPIAETGRPSPFSPYGAHKFMMEELCRSYAASYGLRIVLPRLFSVYGPGLKKQLVWDLCEKLAGEGAVDLGGTGEELRDWIDVRDVARVLAHLAAKTDLPAPEVNVASGKATSVREVAAMVAARWMAGAERRLKFNGWSRPGDPFSLVGNVERMRACGLQDLIPLSHGIADYVDWFRGSHGIVP